MFEGSIDCNNSLRAATHQETRIFLDQIRFMAVMSAEIKITFLHEVIANAAHDHRVVTVAEFGNKYANGECALLPQGAREKTRLVIKFARRSADTFASFVRNGSAGDIVQNQRNRCGAKAEVVSENF